MNNTVDVAVCGGGLAGLTLALQLKQQMPEVEVALVDRLSRPLPAATLKVGESLVETGSYYLSGILGLEEYLDEAHLEKMGFRFFFDGGRASFPTRPEFGLAQFPGVKSYQIDRGIIENDLRQMIEDAGVRLWEGWRVQDIQLGNDNEPHAVTFCRRETGVQKRLAARWVIDAMGRRRYLQKQLNLTRDHGQKCSAAWFRLPGRIDVDDLVPSDEAEWHNRVSGKNRYYSTNHLMGDGYWVWLIPLSSSNTSLGIVALEEYHPFSEFNNYPAAKKWLEEHEPELAAYVSGREPLDFRCMRQYSYASHQLFSHNRWACIGEASLFPDPFYALASDLIGFENSIVTHLVGLDREAHLTQETVDHYNQFVLALNHWLTSNIQLGYPFFGNGVVMACKVLWDTAGGWANLGPQMFNAIFLDQEAQARFRKVSGRFFFLTRIMQILFGEWAANSTGRLSYKFIDFLSVPFMKEMQMRNLRSAKGTEQVIEDQVVNMQKLEELAQAIFLLAVEDTLPEQLERFRDSEWLNAWAISLEPEKWESAGLFLPFTEPGDLVETREQIRSLFQIAS